MPWIGDEERCPMCGGLRVGDYVDHEPSQTGLDLLREIAFIAQKSGRKALLILDLLIHIARGTYGQPVQVVCQID